MTHSRRTHAEVPAQCIAFYAIATHKPHTSICAQWPYVDVAVNIMQTSCTWNTAVIARLGKTGGPVCCTDLQSLAEGLLSHCLLVLLRSQLPQDHELCCDPGVL